jgi:hypothetical protein
MAPHVVAHGPHQLDEERLLAWEVEVERALGDAGRARDVDDGGAVEAVASEDLLGGGSWDGCGSLWDTGRMLGHRECRRKAGVRWGPVTIQCTRA